MLLQHLDIEGTPRDLEIDGQSVRWSASGHLLVARSTELWAVPFDLESQQVVGDAFRIATRLRSDGNGGGDFDISGDGTLVWIEPGGFESSLVWVDRDDSHRELWHDLVSNGKAESGFQDFR